MKKFFLLPIIAIFFLTSCEETEINNYYEEHSKTEKFVTFQQPVQVIEERRDQMNTKIMYSENNQIPGRVEINFIDPETGEIEYSTERILLSESGYIETGKTTSLNPEVYYTIEIRNLDENDYAYNFGNSENYENSSKIFTDFIFTVSPLEFSYESYYPSSMESGNYELSARETITVSGGYVKLVGINFYKKSDIDPWAIFDYSYIAESYGGIGSVNSGNENNWTEDGDYYYSSIEELNVQFWDNNETHIFYLHDLLKSISEGTEVEYYSEYIFKDQWGNIIKFQTEPHTSNIEDVEAITEIDFRTYDINLNDSGWQLGGRLEGDINIILQIQRLDIIKDMNNPWNEFSAIKIVNGNGVTLVSNLNLDQESEWDSVSYGYRLRFNNIDDVIDVDDDFNYRIYYKLKPGAASMDIETYIDGRYMTEDGINHYFQSDDDDLEIN